VVQIKISTRHGQVSDETREKIGKKVERLPRFYDRLSAIEVTIDLEHRDAPSVDVKATAKHREFVASSQSAELMASIDQAVDKLEQQLRKHKEKAVDRHRGSGHR